MNESKISKISATKWYEISKFNSPNSFYNSLILSYNPLKTRPEQVLNEFNYLSGSSSSGEDSVDSIKVAGGRGGGAADHRSNEASDWGKSCLEMTSRLFLSNRVFMILLFFIRFK